MEIAEEFDHYFTSIGQTLATKFDLSASYFDKQTNVNPEKSFALKLVLPSEVKSTMNSIRANKAAGFDDIVKQLFKTIGQPVINESIKADNVPKL